MILQNYKAKGVKYHSELFTLLFILGRILMITI